MLQCICSRVLYELRFGHMRYIWVDRVIVTKGLNAKIIFFEVVLLSKDAAISLIELELNIRR